MALDGTKVKVGAGYLYFNTNLSSTEPTDLVTAWATVDAGWLQLGYTDGGSQANINPKFDPIDVEEELTPVRYEENMREIGMDFALAEMTARNLQIVHNGGTLVTGTGIVTFEPPVTGSVTRIKLGWQSLDNEERWVFRQCVQTGSIAINRKKSPNKATLPASFRCETPNGATRPFKAIFASRVAS